VKVTDPNLPQSRLNDDDSPFRPHSGHADVSIHPLAGHAVTADRGAASRLTMTDHVTIRVDDLDASRRFYGLALRMLAFLGPPTEGAGFVEWNDFSIGEATSERPPTRQLQSASRPPPPTGGRLVAGDD
jgi:hypothetical protein